MQSGHHTLIIGRMQVTIQTETLPQPQLAGQAFTFQGIVEIAATSHIVSKIEGLKIESQNTT